MKNSGVGGSKRERESERERGREEEREALAPKGVHFLQGVQKKKPRGFFGVVIYKGIVCVKWRHDAKEAIWFA